MTYSDQAEIEEEQDLKDIGWTWTADPDGRTFYRNKETEEKSWNTSLRVEEVPEEADPGKEEVRHRICGKQNPSKAYLKVLKGIQDEDEDDADVTKTISLGEVYENLVNWKAGMNSELVSEYQKDCLLPGTVEELRERELK